MARGFGQREAIPGRFVRILAWVGLLLLNQAAAPSPAAARDWIEVRSPNFQVFSDRGERTARRVASELERIRQLLQGVLPGATADPLRPVVVIAVRGEDDFVELFPQYADGPRPAGVFSSGGFRHHIVLRVEAGRETIYHEYFHLLTRLNAGRLPSWLVEGLAVVYETTEIKGRTARVGIPGEANLQFFFRRSLVRTLSVNFRDRTPEVYVLSAVL